MTLVVEAFARPRSNSGGGAPDALVFGAIIVLPLLMVAGHAR